MSRQEHINEVQARKIKAWEDAFKVFVEGAGVHGSQAYNRAVKVMNAIDEQFTANLLNEQGEVECEHCGWVCDCAYYEAGGEYPD